MNIALLIDGENVPARLLLELERQIAPLGNPIVRCVFGDFAEIRLSCWIAAARDDGIELVFQPSQGKNKNSTDIALTIRAMELLHAGRIDAFCLASSDRDFAPLALKLRQYDKKVYGFGEAKTADAFRASFDDFFLLGPEVLATPATSPRVAAQAKPSHATPAPQSPVKVKDLPASRIVDFIRKLGEADAEGYVQLAVVGQMMHRQAPDLARLVSGKGKLLKNLQLTGKIEQSGVGSAIKVRLRRPA